MCNYKKIFHCASATGRISQILIIIATKTIWKWIFWYNVVIIIIFIIVMIISKLLILLSKIIILAMNICTIINNYRPIKMKTALVILIYRAMVTFTNDFTA